MKNLFFTFCLLGFSLISQAAIYRVGYQGLPLSGVDYAYNDFQYAVNAASAGDTLQLYQQTVNYATSATISKPLTILGFGHSLNTNPNLQIQNSSDSTLNQISLYFYDGSQGSVLQGLNLGVIEIFTSDITITRCRFKSGQYTSTNYGSYPSYMNDCSTGLPFMISDGGYIGIHGYYNTVNNVKISNCYFDNFNESATWYNQEQHTIYCDGSYAISNLIIYNNYFNSTVSLRNNNSTNGSVNGVFANNVINFKFRKLFNIAHMIPYSGTPQNCTEGFFDNYPQFTGSGMQSRFDQFLVKNNIFNTADTVTWPMIANTSIVEHNVFSCASQYAGPTLSSGNNVFSANMNNVFAAGWNNGMVLNDDQLALGSSSPATGTGIKYNNTTTDCGVFGGEVDQEYKLSGIPPIPAFYQLSAPGINATTNPYNITISVRSNK